MQYSDEEFRPPPRLRSYDEYIRAGREAEERNKDVDGVKGVWVLHRLPYAEYIHWTVDMMHSMANVIQDTLNSMRPTNSGSNKLYKHINRTYCAPVMAASLEEGTFRVPFNEMDGTNIPPWCLTKEECILADERMNYILGGHEGDEFPKDVMRAGRAKKSHDTIFWATTFSAWCLRGFGPYIDHVIHMFDHIGRLQGSSIATELVMEGSDLRKEFVSSLVQREGMMPPSESTSTFHELFHLLDQMSDVGCPRYSTLYKFEKMNKILKRNLKNTAKGTP